MSEMKHTPEQRGTHGHEVSKELGAELKSIRTGYGISRRILTDLTGVSERTLSRWETEGVRSEKYDELVEVMASYIAEQARARAGVTTLSPLTPADIPTVDLALELAERARRMEERNRAFDKLKEELVARELD